MAWFKRKKDDDDELTSKNYDFASMVKSARESDPSRFKQVQAAFKKNRQAKKQKKNSK
ncbi:hypothetical protein [Lacticaseibacillus sp. GG6-2]